MNKSDSFSPPRHPRVIAFVTALVAAAFVSGSSGATLTFHPTKDVTAKAAFPTTNYGTDTNLQISAHSGFQKNSFLQFTVSGIPSGSSGISAKLHLTSQTTLSGAASSALSVSSTSWSETTLTWSNQPALGGTLSTISSFTSGSDAIWDVSAEVTGNGTYALGLNSTYTGGDITFGSRESGTPPSLVVTYTPPAAGITVKNGNLALDGNLWIPKGLVMVGLVAPDAKLSGTFLTASQHWGQPELDAATSWHADMIRFQVSPCGLDSQSPIYDPNYINEIVNAVTLARNSGFKVLISMQHQSPSGCPVNIQEPAADVERAWTVLAPKFNGDLYVMYEMYNEPDAPDQSMSPTTSDWTVWQNGSTSLGYVGFQAVVNTIRGTGSSNLIVADGLRQARTFGNSPTPLLTDSKNNLAYGVHTYFNGGSNNTSSEWDTHFGNFHAAGNAVLGTEWNACADLGDCRSTDPTDAANLISYMRGKDIGNSSWAFDILDKVTLNWSWTPNFYDGGYTCSPSGTEGPGTIVKNDYTAH